MSKTKTFKTDMASIMADIKKSQEKKAEKSKVNAKALFDTLSDTRVASIEVTFDGCGDSGQINDITFTDHRGKDLSCPKLIVKGSHLGHQHQWDEKKKEFVEVGGGEGDVSAIVEEICYDRLGAYHSGWEINEGSYGTFNFDVLNRKINLEFNERVETIRSSEECF
jgi:hypothetical protein